MALIPMPPLIWGLWLGVNTNCHNTTLRRRAEAAENHGEELRNTLDGMKLKLEEKDMDLDHLRQEAEVMKEKWSNDKEKIDRLEDAKRRLADELDVARAKAGELSKAESTVEKYKKKLDEMATAKQHIQQIEEQNSKYLEQVSDVYTRVDMCLIHRACGVPYNE